MGSPQPCFSPTGFRQYPMFLPPFERGEVSQKVTPGCVLSSLFWAPFFFPMLRQSRVWNKDTWTSQNGLRLNKYKPKCRYLDVFVLTPIHDTCFVLHCTGPMCCQHLWRGHSRYIFPFTSVGGQLDIIRRIDSKWQMSDKTNLSFRHSLFFCFIHSFHEWISRRKKFYLILNLDLPTQPLEEEPQVPEVKIHAAVSHQPTLATTRI